MNRFDEQSLAKPKILVVDDRKENLVASRKILKSINAEIVEADSGNEALSKMLRHQFAVVLLDVQMPEMDGFEVASLMHEHDELKEIPIIFVTAISKEERYVDQAAQIGAVDYIFKPINPNILKSKVQVYVDLFLAQERLKRINRELVKSNDELERFAYICSHDLQEPVRMMESFSGLVLKKYKDALDTKGQEYLRFIGDNAAHMQRMISDILAFSRIGREAIELEDVDCNEVLQEVLKKFQSQIDDKQASIKSAPLPVVSASKILLNVLLQNLVGNALKYHDGSQPPEISIDCQQGNDLWTFSVADNGIGIDMADTDKVFGMFQRIHRKDKYPGTGIGLATCKKFVELFGGAIWFESKPGQGTLFSFTIPKHPGIKKYVAA